MHVAGILEHRELIQDVCGLAVGCHSCPQVIGVGGMPTLDLQ
jgi:hypothetical protein